MNNPRQLCLWGLSLICAGLAACTTKPVAPHRICSTSQARPWSLLGEIRWQHDRLFADTPVGGLSSIDYDAGSHLYYLVSDDRSAHGPARFYTARIEYDASGLHQVRVHDARPLLSSAQAPYPSHRQSVPGIATPDAEALRLPASKSQGPRSNFTLEGMALSEDGATLWLAMEAALRQDGPLPAADHLGGPVRITTYDMGTRQPVRQLAYQPDALPAGLWLQRGAINGISAVLADGPEHLLVLERSFAPPLRFGARIYRISTRADASSDTLGQTRLVPGSYRPADKELLLDLADAGLRSVDNLEGMSWGPPLPDGRRVLLLVSDNNFNPAEVTQFIALSEEHGRCGAGL